MRSWLCVAVWILLLAVSCGDDEDGGDSDRTCGDSVCSQATCESEARCPEDCGACIGANCDSGGATGRCGQSCTDSCLCPIGEVCTRDYGVDPGTCVPVACLQCDTFSSCNYTPNADGACLNVTCSN